MTASTFSVMDMALTVRRLLDTDGLGLAEVPDPSLPAAAWDAEVSWVHSSDLLDPSPFLMEAVVLLTTGTQFASPELTQDDWDGYVGRLVGAGVAALGFGTEVVRDGVPAPLTLACSRASLPLFIVPFQTPFIAVARTQAEAVAARTDAARAWAFDAQRALARAALGSDVAASVVRVLAQYVGGWVGLFDAAGEVTESFMPRQTQQTMPGPEEIEAVSSAARTLLQRASRAAAPVQTSGRRLSLQTLGGNGRLTGVLAVADPVGSSPRDIQSVVTSALALLGLATGQAEQTLAARLSLNSALFELLLQGETTVAQTVAAASAPLPRAPVALLLGGSDDDAERLENWLEARPARTRRGILVARHDNRCAIIVSPAAAPHAAEEIVRVFGGTWGLSAPCGIGELAQALTQAQTCLEAKADPAAGEGLTRWADVVGHDPLALVDSPAAAAAARTILDPLLRHDRRQDSHLLDTLASWLEHNGKLEETAAELGVHRHTVRTRIHTAERVLGHSLSDFESRARLWTALRLTEK